MFYCDYVPGQARDDTPGCLWVLRHPGREVCHSAERCGFRCFTIALTVIDEQEIEPR
jgi:hypothetical protein